MDFVQRINKTAAFLNYQRCSAHIVYQYVLMSAEDQSNSNSNSLLRLSSRIFCQLFYESRYLG